MHEWESEEEAAKSDLRRADLMRDDKIISEEDMGAREVRVDETIAEVSRYHNEQAAAEADLTTAKPSAGAIARGRSLCEASSAAVQFAHRRK